MRVLSNRYGHKMSYLDGVKWRARYSLLSASYDKMMCPNFSNLKELFIIGSEMEGYYEILGHDHRWPSCVYTCIDFYLDTVHKARVAALYTVWGTRSLGVVRDVAKIIGRLIYASRKDVYLWNAPIRKLKK